MEAQALLRAEEEKEALKRQKAIKDREKFMEKFSADEIYGTAAGSEGRHAKAGIENSFDSNIEAFFGWIGPRMLIAP